MEMKVTDQAEVTIKLGVDFLAVHSGLLALPWWEY